jgi:hypothetical protein
VSIKLDKLKNKGLIMKKQILFVALACSTALHAATDVQTQISTPTELITTEKITTQQQTSFFASHADKFKYANYTLSCLAGISGITIISVVSDILTLSNDKKNIAAITFLASGLLNSILSPLTIHALSKKIESQQNVTDPMQKQKNISNTLSLHNS